MTLIAVVLTAWALTALGFGTLLGRWIASGTQTAARPVGGRDEQSTTRTTN